MEKAHQWHLFPLNCTFLHCIRKPGQIKGCRSIFFNEIKGLARVLHPWKREFSLIIRHLQVTLQVTSQVKKDKKFKSNKFKKNP
jgi:hypothetical protein